MKRILLALAVAALVAALLPVPCPAEDLPKVTGTVWLTHPVFGPAFASFQVHASSGVPGEDGYRPVRGTILLAARGVECTYDVTTASFGESNASFRGVSAEGAPLYVLAWDGGSPGPGNDTFWSGSSGMFVVPWTVVDGNLAVH